MPQRKNIKILPFDASNKYAGASDYIYDSNSNIIGMTLELPVRRSKISPSTIVTLMHENTHVLETLSNPKHTSLTQKMTKRGMYNDNYDRWFNSVLYSPENIEVTDKNSILSKVRVKTEDFLRVSNIKDRILYLQDARYQLEQEKNAYLEQLKYAKKISKKGINLQKDDLEDFDKVYMFTEKIKLLKEMTCELISRERKKILNKFKK